MVTSGIGSGVYCLAAPGDRERLFIVDQEGNVWIVVNDVKQPTPFLDITSLTTRNGEQGFLGMAFHPDYQNNGWFYVNYTTNAGDTRVDRFTVSSNPDLADFGSQVNILSVAQPFTNHNGGCLRFGPDGYLYIGLGDGGSFGDPGNRAQDGQVLLGKMLRLDVDNGLPYTIPASNPFVGDPAVLDEIWALGLRNPWRFNFDDETGDLYIADVGQNLWEYVHVEPAGDPGGRNYGWNIIEGSHCYSPGVGCNMTGLEMPVFEYAHTVFPTARCAILGGEVYRGRSMATMSGRYFFSDACSLEVWSFRYDPVSGGYTDFVDHTAESGVAGATKSLGYDGNGELYFSKGWALFRAIPDGMRLEVPHLFTGVADTIVVTNALPSQPVYLAYSTHGVGDTPIPSLGVSAQLERPRLAATLTADAAGEVQLPVVPPSVLFGRTLYLQALQTGQVSNVFREQVE